MFAKSQMTDAFLKDISFILNFGSKEEKIDN